THGQTSKYYIEDEALSIAERMCGPDTPEVAAKPSRSATPSPKSVPQVSTLDPVAVRTEDGHANMITIAGVPDLLDSQRGSWFPAERQASPTRIPRRGKPGVACRRSIGAMPSADRIAGEITLFVGGDDGRTYGGHRIHQAAQFQVESDQHLVGA